MRGTTFRSIAYVSVGILRLGDADVASRDVIMWNLGLSAKGGDSGNHEQPAAAAVAVGTQQQLAVTSIGQQSVVVVSFGLPLHIDVLALVLVSWRDVQ